VVLAAAFVRLAAAGATELLPSVFGPKRDRDRTLVFLGALAASAA
jgi:hypothetical protein